MGVAPSRVGGLLQRLGRSDGVTVAIPCDDLVHQALAFLAIEDTRLIQIGFDLEFVRSVRSRLRDLSGDGLSLFAEIRFSTSE